MAGSSPRNPYVSSGAYINRMSDYCKSCRYKVQDKTGKDACPFNTLYWHFLDRHSENFAKNQRMSTIYANWKRMDEDRKQTILSEAEAFLDGLS